MILLLLEVFLSQHVSRHEKYWYTFLFFHKYLVHKNIQAQIFKNFKNIIRNFLGPDTISRLKLFPEQNSKNHKKGKQKFPGDSTNYHNNRISKSSIFSIEM